MRRAVGLVLAVFAWTMCASSALASPVGFVWAASGTGELSSRFTVHDASAHANDGSWPGAPDSNASTSRLGSRSSGPLCVRASALLIGCGVAAKGADLALSR